MRGDSGFSRCSPGFYRGPRLSIKYRQPHGRDRRVGTVDPVTAMRRNFQPIAGLENPDFGVISKAQPRAAGEHDHPFHFRLVVPEPRWARLPP